MIEITCNNCKKVSENPYEFDNVRYHYTELKEITKGGHRTGEIHLCSKCKIALDETVIKAQSNFLGVAILGILQTSKGVI